MVIIDNNFEHKIHNVIKDINGRYVIIDIKLPGIARLLLLNCTHQIEMIQRRPGIQKLNNSLLLNNEFTSEMRKEIKLIIATYACTPAYHPDFIQTQNYEQIELMIDIALLWEVLLALLRGTMISFSSKKKVGGHSY